MVLKNDGRRVFSTLIFTASSKIYECVALDIVRNMRTFILTWKTSLLSWFPHSEGVFAPSPFCGSLQGGLAAFEEKVTRCGRSLAGVGFMPGCTHELLDISKAQCSRTQGSCCVKRRWPRKC